MKYILSFLILTINVAFAQNNEQNYTNLALDYNRCDVVALMKIKNCSKTKLGKNLFKITVSVEVIKTYKGYFDNNNYSYTVTETEAKCNKINDLIGVFLTQTDPKSVKQPLYSSIENSGFTLKDTVFIQQLSNLKILSKYIKKSLDSATDESINEEVKWVKAKVIQVKKPQTIVESFEHQIIQIMPTQDYPKARMKKGKIYFIEIDNSAYGGYRLKYLLEKNKTYEFPIWVDDVGQYPVSNIEFVIKNN